MTIENEEPNTHIEGITEITITDITGKIISSKLFNYPFKTTEINITNLPNGMYILKLQSKDGISVGRFVKTGE